jgi:hypothetical protein
MLTINEQGSLEAHAFTNQTLSWGETYKFVHNGCGRVIAKLIAEDQDWYFLELTDFLETQNTYLLPGQRFPIRKNLVRSIEMS